MADVPAITSIYNQGIADRVATFETEPRTEKRVRAWLDGRHPVVVVERDGDVIAFASASTYRPRACYDGIAECSIYVDRAARGQGAGTIAIEALMRAASGAGFWKLVSRVFVENTASRRLLRAAGFREVGVYQRHGRLDGTWRDVVIVERLLDPAWEGPVHGLWQPDDASIAAWDRLTPGAAILVMKRQPDGSDGPTYPAVVMESTAPAPWVEVRAEWAMREVDAHGLLFSPGDELREFFSPLHPFNAFAVYAPGGSLKGWYGNVTRPARLDISGDHPRLVWPDLVLDVIQLADGTLHELDDDELAASGLPDTDSTLAAQVADAREHLRGLLRQGFFPRR